MIVKLNEDTISALSNGIMSGTVEKATIEPRSKTKKGITFFMHYELYDNGVKENVTTDKIDAAKSLLTFWDKYQTNQVNNFVFRKNGIEPILCTMEYSPELPESYEEEPESALELATKLKEVLSSNPSFDNVTLLNNNKLSLKNAMENIYNTLINGGKK